MNHFDHNAERQVIGAAFLGEIEPLEPEDFHDQRHRRWWQVIRELAAERKPITIDAVALRLNGDGYTALPELTGIIAGASTLSSEEYAGRVRDLARRRGVMAALEKAARALNAGDAVDGVVAHLHADSLEHAKAIQGAGQLSPSVVVDKFLDAVENPRETWGLRSGIGAIDTELGGIHKGETFLIAGDPGVGKSIFTSQLAFQIAGVDFWQNQIVGKSPGVMYHLEMSGEAVIRRAICAKARVNYRNVRTGQLTDDEKKRFLEAAEHINLAPVFISDATDWTTTMLRADIVRLMSEYGIEWALVDYAGLLKDPADSDLSREIAVSKALHDIAKMGVAMIVVETLNKSGMRGERNLSGVRGSVQKTYDADVVAFLQVPPDLADSKTTQRELKFTKAREADMFMRIPFNLAGAQKRFEPVYSGSLS